MLAAGVGVLEEVGQEIVAVQVGLGDGCYFGCVKLVSVQAAVPAAEPVADGVVGPELQLGDWEDLHVVPGDEEVADQEDVGVVTEDWRCVQLGLWGG